MVKNRKVLCGFALRDNAGRYYKEAGCGFDMHGEVPQYFYVSRKPSEAMAFKTYKHAKAMQRMALKKYGCRLKIVKLNDVVPEKEPNFYSYWNI